MKQEKVLNYNSSAVRSVTIEGEPWFSVSDVGKILQLTNVHKHIIPYDQDMKSKHKFSTRRGKQPMTIINARGLQRLLEGCGKPKVADFKKWLNSEALPEIYKTSPPQMTELEMMVALAQLLIKKQKQKDTQTVAPITPGGMHCL